MSKSWCSFAIVRVFGCTFAFQGAENLRLVYQDSPSEPKSISILQGKLTELETELLEINSNSEKLRRSQSELVELKLVLEKVRSNHHEGLGVPELVASVGLPVSALLF